MAAGVFGASLALLWARRATAVAVGLAVAGLWWGGARLEALSTSVLEGRVGEAARALVVVTGPPRGGEFGVRAPAELRRFGNAALRERVLLRLPPGRRPAQGAILSTVAKIEAPRPPEGDFDERAWLARQGIHAVVRGSRWSVVGRRGGIGGVSDRLRRSLESGVAPGLRGERRAVLAGIVLGADEGLSDELRDSFRVSGLYHFLAVSGQNVAIVVGGVLGTFWLLGFSRLVGQAVALVAIAVYVLAVGWQPSVVRAGVAGALASLAWLAARPRDRWYFLLVGAVVLLAWNPASLLEAGFQLSFTAVAAIFVAVPRLERRLEGYPLPRGLAGALAVSAACAIATLPILLLQFGHAIAAPAVAPAFAIGLVTALVEPVSHTSAVALAWANGWLAAYIAACARLVAGLPLSQTSSLPAAAVLGAVSLAVLGSLRLPPARRRRALTSLAVVATVALAWQLRPQAAAAPPDGLRITFLDVGQGDATLIETPEATVLVDGGPPEANVAGKLRARGVRRVNALFLSHPSRDNVGGSLEVVRQLDVAQAFYPELPFENPYAGPALAEARRRGIPVMVTRAGQTFRAGPLRLEVLWPDGRPVPTAADPNDHTTVLLLSYGQFDALLPADAEADVTLGLPVPPVELLKVGHHGSKDDRLDQLLARLRPRVAVISCGAGNDYGHPAPSTVAALRDSPALALYRTDLGGEIVVESDGERIEVRQDE